MPFLVHLCTPHDVISMKQCHLVVEHTLIYILSKFEANLMDGSGDISTFVSSPCFSWSDHYLTTRDMASELTPQQLITQSAKATANAIASALMARTASISLPVYDWDSKDAYHSFSIFQHTLENWVLLNCIMPDSDDHLQYIFAALGTKSLEMHTQWMPTGSKEEQRVTKAKASAFLDWINQAMTHDINTHVHLGELEDVVARPGEDPQDLVTHIKTLHHRIICAYCHKGKLLGKLMAKPFKTPSCELADIAVNHFTIQHAWEQVSHNTKPVDTICHDRHWAAHTSHNSNGHTPSAPPRTAPTAHNSTQLAEQTALHEIPIALNAARQDTWDQSAVVASHSNQGMCLHQEMHPQLGHSRWSPDAHLGTTTTALGGVAKQMP